ncbi:MAG: HAMP domain-containing histidine kinase, partial [Bacteroidia bacterium]|nr:HAMP domain-containing histidine kinase [Bacteroidia bacterium]
NKSVYYVLQLLPIVINEQVHGLSLTIINVTEQKKMELQQQKITQDLINRNRDLEQFGYTISHNLRSPLTNIIGLYNLLKTSPNEEERNYILEKIGTSSHRLDNIVKDLNEILQRNKSITENKATIHFYAIIKNIEASIELLLTNSKTTIEIDVKDAPEIYTIKTYLRSILENLITNSIKYAKQNENPHIIIKSCKKDKNIILSFKDNGIGIDMEKHKNQIFGLYKRFDNTKEGKGLGLYMVKSQVERLGGKIEIKSEVGIGTEFILTFPEK